MFSSRKLRVRWGEIKKESEREEIERTGPGRG